MNSERRKKKIIQFALRGEQLERVYELCDAGEALNPTKLVKKALGAYLKGAIVTQNSTTDLDLIKKYTGIYGQSDLIRFLVREKAREIRVKEKEMKE